MKFGYSKLGATLCAALLLCGGWQAYGAPDTQPSARTKSFAGSETLPSEPIPAPAWNIDGVHSKIAFSIRHIFTPVAGKFDKYAVDLKFDTDNLKGSSVDVTIPVSSINTDNQRRDGHLLTEDFFHTENFPNISFKGTTFRRIRGTPNQYEIEGDFTIRDVTRKIVLPFRLLGTMVHPMKKGHLVMGAEATIKINRNDYGVGTGSWAATAIVGDEVNITIFIEATRPI